MRMLIINPPHPAIGSRIPREQLPPLGLLSIGGSLIDAGHDVQLVDGEFGPMTDAQLLAEVARIEPEAVMFGHSGSTSGHPIVARLSRAIHAEYPAIRILYGGVFPTYHWREILQQEPKIEVLLLRSSAPALRLPHFAIHLERCGAADTPVIFPRSFHPARHLSEKTGIESTYS